MAIIDGSSLEKLLEDTEQIRVGNPYGLQPSTSIGEKSVAFLHPHSVHHSTPPHKVNYRANVYVLFEMGVKRILATNAAGAINVDFKPSDLIEVTVVPEALLASEQEMCYATVSFVSNMAAGTQRRLTAQKVAEIAKGKMSIIQQVLKETIRHLLQNRDYLCAHTLKDAKFRG